MKKKPILYRQGDVLIQRVTSLPKNITKSAHENERVILAHGEVTGHAHSFAANEVAKFTDQKGAEFFEIKGRPMNLRLPIVRRWKHQVMMDHPEFGIIEFAEGDVKISGDNVIVDGSFALLKHDEHSTQGIPAGLYIGGSDLGTVRQREYSPEAIRRVVD